ITLQLQQQHQEQQYHQQNEYYQQQQQPPPQQLQPAFQVGETMVHQPVVSTPQVLRQSWDYQSPSSMSVNQPVITPQLHTLDPMGAMYHQQQPFAFNSRSQGYTLSPSQHSLSQFSPSQHSPQSLSHTSSRGHSQSQSRSHSRPQTPPGPRVQPLQPDMCDETPVPTNYFHQGKMEL
ncbi:MAG: hypothetical protein BYD32DRAFT_465672, partial [Podila humilis]